MMPDYHNPDDPFYHNFDEPLLRDYPEARAANAGWFWTGVAVFLVVVLVVTFGTSHRNQINTASNDVTPPPAINHMSRPAISPAPPTTPAPNIPL